MKDAHGEDMMSFHHFYNAAFELLDGEAILASLSPFLLPSFFPPSPPLPNSPFFFFSPTRHAVWTESAEADEYLQFGRGMMEACFPQWEDIAAKYEGS